MSYLFTIIAKPYRHNYLCFMKKPTCKILRAPLNLSLPLHEFQILTPPCLSGLVTEHLSICKRSGVYFGFVVSLFTVTLIILFGCPTNEARFSFIRFHFLAVLKFVMCSTTEAHIVNIDVVDTLITPLSCSVVANEIMKCLLYQKSQIPYPFSWLKNVVNRRRIKFEENGDEDTFSNLRVARQYHIVSTAYDALEDIMKNLRVEFQREECDVTDILFVFGPTIYTPKEIFLIKLPTMNKGHLDQIHAQIEQKNHRKILK